MTGVRRAVVAVLLALGMLGAVLLTTSAATAAATSVSATDRDLIIRVRQAGLWEHPAGLAAESRGVSAKVREIGAKIAAEHQDLDQIVLKVAAEVGVSLPDAPTDYQRDWLNEMATAQGEEFDRVFVARLREAHGIVFPLIAGVRAGTRNDAVRAFAITANEYVQRHLGYLDNTGLVNYATLPAPTEPTFYRPNRDESADTYTLASGGALGAFDRELLARVHQEALWRQPAALAAAQRGSSPTVRVIGELIADDESELEDVVRALAVQLGVSLPDYPDADQRDWLSDIQTLTGDEFDRAFVDRLRASSGTLLVSVAGVRAGTRNDLMRAFAVTANDSVMRDLGYLESSGLVNFDDLPWPSAPAGVRVPGFERDGGLPPIGLWMVLATAVIAGLAALGRLVRSR